MHTTTHTEPEPAWAELKALAEAQHKGWRYVRTLCDAAPISRVVMRNADFSEYCTRWVYRNAGKGAN